MLRHRRATSGDLANIRHLRKAALRVLGAKTYDPVTLAGLIQHTGTDAADLAELGTLHVLERDGEIVACGGWRADNVRDFACIEWVHVDPGFAREGLASRLVSIVEAEIAAAGYAHVEASATLNAMPFFTAMGYRPERLVRPDGLGSTIVTGAAMAKSIAAPMAAAA